MLSPHDQVVQSLTREAELKTEGEIHIMQDDQNPPTLARHYSLIFTPYIGSRGAVPVKKIFGKEALHDFLVSRLGISLAFVSAAINEVNQKGNASTQRVQLTHREARRLGLA